jgi:hypothetical protein
MFGERKSEGASRGWVDSAGCRARCGGARCETRFWWRLMGGNSQDGSSLMGAQEQRSILG